MGQNQKMGQRDGTTTSFYAPLPQGWGIIKTARLCDDRRMLLLTAFLQVVNLTVIYMTVF